MMKKLALILTLLMLSSAAQAEDYIKETTLYCTHPIYTTETFTLNGAHRIGSRAPRRGWIVKRISQLKYSIEVRLDGPNGETLWIDFNNGWPCRIETRHKPIQPESDNFNQID